MKQLNFAQFFSYFMGLFAFAIIALPKLNGLFILLLALVIAFGHVKKLFTWKFNWSSLFFIALYLAYLIGILFSEDKTEGLKYAEYKLSFLIIPIAFSMVPKFEFNLRHAIYGLVLGVLFLATLGLKNGFECYEGHDLSWLRYCFTSSLISPIHHPTYFSCYIIFSLATVYYGFKKKWLAFSSLNVFLFFVVGLLLYLLCMSLAGILFLGLVIAFIVVFYLKKKLTLKWFLPLMGATLVGLILAIRFAPIVKDEVNDGKKAYEQFAQNPDRFLFEHAKDSVIEGNHVRLIMWKVSLDLIAENPLGVGTGSVDEHLNRRLKRYGLHQMAELDYNPHNQFLQTALELGLLGLTLLLSLFVFILYFSIKHKSLLLFLLIGCLVFNSLFESMFQRQSGIVFFTFWISLLVMEILQRTQAKKNSNLT